MRDYFFFFATGFVVFFAAAFASTFFAMVPPFSVDLYIICSFFENYAINRPRKSASLPELVRCVVKRGALVLVAYRLHGIILGTKQLNAFYQPVSDRQRGQRRGVTHEPDRLNYHLVTASGPARDRGGEIYRERVWVKACRKRDTSSFA